MNLTVDGHIYELQRAGGISNLFSQVLPRLCGKDPLESIDFLLSRRALQPPPSGSCIRLRRRPHVERYLRPQRVWWRAHPAAHLGVNRLAARDTSGIWQSTYYTRCLGWRGPKVVCVYDMIFELFPELFTGGWNDQTRRQKRLAVLEADAVIAISSSTRNDLLRIHPELDPNLVHVVHLAADRRFRPAATQTGGDRPYVLYVGPRSHHKNFDILLDAYARWDHRGDVPLECVGPPPSAAELARFEAQGLTESIRITSGADNDTLTDLYRGALAFVYPSLYEGFGIPLLEALGTGCPVIASRIPSSVEVAGDVALYFDPEDAEDLRSALDRVLTERSDPVARGERRRRGIEQAGRYSWDLTAEGFLEVYRSVSR